MTGKSSPRRLLEEVGRRNIWRVLGLYVGGGWVVLQVLDLFIERGFLPEWVFAGALAMLTIGLPLVLLTAWVQGGRMGVRVSRPDEPEPQGFAAETVFTWNRSIVVGVAAFALLGLATSVYMIMRVTGVGSPATLAAQGVFEVGSRVVLADFESSAGDAAPSDLITEALRIDLAQSSALSLVAPAEVARALELMRHERGAPISESVAREVAVRSGAPVVIAGELGRLGSGFVLTAMVLEAESGNVLASFRVTADDEEGLIDAIDELSSRMRTKIGESLRSVASSEPLPSVTTGSLEALRKFTAAVRGVQSGRLSPPVAQGLLQEALALDSTFAMGHRALAVQITNYGGDREVAARAIEAAFHHRQRLPERERLIIEASYYKFRLGDERRAIEAHRRMLALDTTDAFTATNLGDALTYAGAYEEAVQVLRRTPSWDSQPWTWNLTVAYAASNRLAEALAVRDTAEEAAPGEPYAKATRVILLATSGEIERARAALADGPETTYPAAVTIELYDHAVLDVLTGRLEAAERRLAEVDERMAREASPSDRLLFGMALPWTLSWIAGDHERAEEEVVALLDRVGVESLSPFNREHPLVALTYALAGRTSRATEQLERYRAEAGDVPDPTSEARARIAAALLDVDARGATAIGELESAVEAMQCARCRDFFLGHGYERAGLPGPAIEAYERFLAHPFFDGSDFVTHIFGTAVHERLGRLHDESGDAERAADHFRVFAAAWAEADPDLQPRVRFAAERADELVRRGP